MEAIQTFKIKDLTVEIFHDETPESPREWDNVGTMVCFSRKYDLGDKHRFDGGASVLRYLKESDAVWLPVYLYDNYHPSLSTSVSDMVTAKLHFDKITEDTCDEDINDYLWPSNQCGVVYVLPEKLIKEYGSDSAESRAQALNRLQSEIETYSQYLEGEIYGYVVTRQCACKTCEHVSNDEVDSCWGFYGIEDCISEARAAAISALKPKRKSRRNKSAANSK